MKKRNEEEGEKWDEKEKEAYEEEGEGHEEYNDEQSRLEMKREGKKK